MSAFNLLCCCGLTLGAIVYARLYCAIELQPEYLPSFCLVLVFVLTLEGESSVVQAGLKLGVRPLMRTHEEVCLCSSVPLEAPSAEAQQRLLISFALGFQLGTWSLTLRRELDCGRFSQSQ